MPSSNGIGLACFQTQHHWVQLHAKPKYIYVYRGVKPNIIGFNYALSPSTYEFGETLNSIPLGSATHRAQVHLGLASY